MSNRKDCVRKRAALVAGAAIYALLFALGSQIDHSGVARLDATLVRIALAFPAALGVLYALFRWVLPKTEFTPDIRPLKPFCVPAAALLLFVCYMPMFLIWYPGTFQYDSMKQVQQIAGSAYDAFHPLLHTLLIRFCLSFYDVFWSMEQCGALYSVMQMLFVSLCFSLACASVSRSVSRRAAWAALAYFALYPLHMAYASSCTKDVLFSASFVLFVSLCTEEIHLGKLGRPQRLQQVVCGVVACLMRNNMIYAMIVWVMVLLLCRKPFRRLLYWGLIVIVLSRGCHTGLMKWLDAEDGEMVEMLSVPLQQLARARLYQPEAFTPQEQALMDEVLCHDRTKEPLYPGYDPTISDPVKNDLDDGLVKERLPELAALWADVGGRCPGVYLDAFLNLALPSIYPYSEYRVSHRYVEMGGDRSLTSPFGLGPMTRPQRFAQIRAWLDEQLFLTGADHIPVLRYAFNTGFIYWLLLLFVLFDVYCGRWKRVMILMLPVFLWGTYLLGPVMQGRYLYPFVCCLPLFAMRLRDESRI